MQLLKHITSLLLLLTIVINCYSQDITLNTQADVNALDPTLTTINGNLLIDDDGSDNIYDLGAIANITSISGDITIRNNDQLIDIVFFNLSNIGGSLNIANSISATITASSLTTIAGSLNISYNNYYTSSAPLNLYLQNLNTIGDNFILKNTQFQNFNGLQNLNSIGGSFHILNNPDLIDIGNFPNLNTIEGNLLIGDRFDDIDSFASWPNSQLGNINGLSNLSSLQGTLKVILSDSLTTLSALQNITNLGGSLIIDSTPNLNSLDAFTTLTSINGNLTIKSTNLSHINELSGITSTSGGIVIQNNSAMSDLSGISNVSTIGGELNISSTLVNNLDILSNITSYPEDITLISNSLLTDVDVFQSLTNIGGSLTLSNMPLTNLDAFQNITSIGGGLSISSLPLTNLDPLQNINNIGGKLVISNLPLTNLDPLQNITSIGGELRISSCPQLTNIDGLSNLTSVGITSVTFFSTALKISNNQALSNINGLSGLSGFDAHVYIQDNPSLESLNGLETIEYIASHLTITNNSSLTNCCAIQQLLSTPSAISGSITINNNPSECSSENDILESSCGIINIIKGNVFLDFNDNCLSNAEDYLLGSTIVEASSEEYDYMTSTDVDGNYIMYVFPGTYQVKTLLETPYSEPCEPFYIADLPNTDEVADIDIPITSIIECPYLEIDISTPALRQCFNNHYTIEYCNKGTQTAINAYIELELDDNLSITNAPLPFSGPDANNVYTFQIGDIEIGACADFIVNIQLPCIPGQAGEFQGQTLCVDAQIYPNDSCLEPFAEWDFSSTKVESECVGDSIQFKIINQGVGNMSTPRTFYVIEDQVMFFQDSYQLLAGEEIQISYEANGSTFRLEADQAPGHPGDSNPSTAEEACLGGSDNTISLGMINQFTQDEADPFVSIDCTTVTGSYDPNDKQGFPNGYGTEHYIEKNTDLEYLIRFQNTGTDTAFTVVVTDIISPLLDITTIDPGVSSHPFTFEVMDSLVSFTFNDILLVDSFTNEAASHGFIKYQISQLPDLDNGNVIENTAEIYFDFNPPIITNTTFHTIGENFITMDLVDNIDLYQIESIIAYPNPFVENITFELKGLEDEIDFQLYDVSGKEVFHAKYDSPRFQFNPGDLNAGIYFYSIKIDNSVLASGKIVLR